MPHSRRAVIKKIAYHLPPLTVTNEQLSAEFPEWPVEKIEAKTGITERHIAGPGECSSDLAYAAACKLFEAGMAPSSIDCLILCTQSPDYALPATACVLQDRLGLPVSALAFDINQGCSGFVYGLGIAKGLLETGQAQRALLLTAETYSKFVHPADRSVRTIFGDGAAATLIDVASDGEDAGMIGPFVWGTDGRGANNLIVRAGGFRTPRSRETAVPVVDESGNIRTSEHLFMDGPEIFDFTLRTVPGAVRTLLDNAGYSAEDIGMFVFHQANQYMLEALRRKLALPVEKMFICIRHCGNTVSSTIPIALFHAVSEGRVRPGDLIMVAGFGVGYSWGAALVRWA